MKTADITDFFRQVSSRVETSLDEILPSNSTPPASIHQAMRYSVFAGGKRLRPALCIAGYRAIRPDWERVLPVAAALEMLHTYSLIHDDLPAMDDDDIRRGQPSCHKKFGEAIAILAGDALLTLAFETIAVSKDLSGVRVLQALGLLGRAAGTSDGMIGGQVLDLEAAGQNLDPVGLDRIHGSKTGALIEASVRIGALLAEAHPEELSRIRTYGARVGLAFQIVDDILDETAKGEALGKTPGKDRAQGKATYPRVHGLDESRRLVAAITAEARRSVSGLGEGARLLVEIADYVETRSH